MLYRNHVVYGGYASARGLAAFYGCLVGSLASGLRYAGLPDPNYLMAFAPRRAYDPILRRECEFRAGFMSDLSGHGFGSQLSPRSLGHCGILGVPFGLCDVDLDLSIGCVLNGLSTNEADLAYVRAAIVDAVVLDITRA